MIYQLEISKYWNYIRTLKSGLYRNCCYAKLKCFGNRSCTICCDHLSDAEVKFHAWDCATFRFFYWHVYTVYTVYSWFWLKCRAKTRVHCVLFVTKSRVPRVGRLPVWACELPSWFFSWIWLGPNWVSGIENCLRLSFRFSADFSTLLLLFVVSWLFCQLEVFSATL